MEWHPGSYIKSIQAIANSQKPKDKKVEYEDINIWKISAEIDLQRPNDLYEDIFAVAHEEHMMMKNHGDMSDIKRPPLGKTTIWGIGEILDMLPKPDDEPNVFAVFEEALRIYCETNKEDKRGCINGRSDKPILTIVPNNR